MFSMPIEGIDGSLDWGKPTLAEAIDLATSEIAQRRFPVNGCITDSVLVQIIWDGSKNAGGVITEMIAAP